MAGDAVPYYPVRCPQCGSSDVRVTSTRRYGLRYHKCRHCSAPFKSVERRTPPPPSKQPRKP